MIDETPTYRITDLAESERPRERLARLGAQSLSNAELLAILLRVGVPGENVVQVGQRGLAEAKTSQIKAAIELGRCMTLESPEERPSINSPADAADLLQYEMGAWNRKSCASFCSTLATGFRRSRQSTAAR